MRRVYTCRIGLAGRCFPWRSVDSPGIYYYRAFILRELGATCPDCIPYGLEPISELAGNGHCMIVMSEVNSVRAVSLLAMVLLDTASLLFPRISEGISGQNVLD